MSAFSEPHARAVRSIRAMWPNVQFVVVGGLAVEHHTKMPWRTTKDLDFAIGIEVGEFPGKLGAASDWDADPSGHEHCKLFEGSLLVDFLPVGSDAASKTKIIWPISGHSMTVIGFHLAFEHQTQVSIGEGVQVAVADLPVVIILKMIAFLDRPLQRLRDMQDILSILQWHEQGAGDRLFDTSVVKLDLPVDEAAAFLVGSDVAAVADGRCTSKINEFMSAMDVGRLDLAAVLCGMKADVAMRLWTAMQLGLHAAKS